MGYSTNYIGQVKIIPEPTIKTVKAIKEIIGDYDNGDIGRNLELSEDMEYIVWRGEEKTYNFETTLNELINGMREKGFNEFDLEGEFKYQGEEFDDRGIVKKVNGLFQRIENTSLSKECKCPNCGYLFEN